ncbi:MAG TPA: hypothetical protein VLC49_03135 [Solirubrobacteraceae bacterium]|nr:hypothetical protein [Solirubrobacteraceae bacterium]
MFASCPDGRTYRREPVPAPNDAPRTTSPEGAAAILQVEPFGRMANRDAIREEGRRLLGFAAADAGEHDVSFTAPSR